MEENRILVVDDEQDLCEIMQFNLENEGYQVAVAYSAEEALARTDLPTFHLFILDIMMGEMSGFKLAQKLNKTPPLIKPLLSLLQLVIRKTIL